LGCTPKTLAVLAATIDTPRSSTDSRASTDSRRLEEALRHNMLAAAAAQRNNNHNNHNNHCCCHVGNLNSQPNLPNLL